MMGPEQARCPRDVHELGEGEQAKVYSCSGELFGIISAIFLLTGTSHDKSVPRIKYHVLSHTTHP